MRPICITTLLLGAAVHQGAANFTSGCSTWYIHGRETLATECQTWNPDKGKVHANLDLNICIGVDSITNSMVWMDGGHAFTHCGNCGLQVNSLLDMECDCIDPQTGGTTTSSINLDDAINNQHDGSLTCL
ncbi:hypothetical protein VMCG_06902 [Cytospora schulzeri]|uniref:Cyanovirin-N domain-containing protein n=1 Tax=Cytospora schulzeri TaxID=448051 RepID=A0A423W2D2_9PEZI|nr:hypothetical protein VMCG_06902 [Valsa malicola]